MKEAVTARISHPLAKVTAMGIDPTFAAMVVIEEGLDLTAMAIKKDFRRRLNLKL